MTCSHYIIWFHLQSDFKKVLQAQHFSKGCRVVVLVWEVLVGGMGKRSVEESCGFVGEVLVVWFLHLQPAGHVWSMPHEQ